MTPPRVSSTDMGDIYYGLVAAGYDTYLAHVDFADLDTWRAVLRDADGPALELACGTGRVLVPLIADGFALDGLDASDEMLAICRAKLDARKLTATLHHAAMEGFTLPTRYAAIFCAAGSLALITTDAAQRAVLAGCRRHLRASGIAAFAMFGATPHGPPGRRLRREAVRPDGRVHRVWEERLVDPAPGVEARRMTHEIVAGGAVVACQSGVTSWRPLPCQALQAMLTDAGFTEVALLRAEGNPAAPEEEKSYIAVGRAGLSPASR